MDIETVYREMTEEEKQAFDLFVDLNFQKEAEEVLVEHEEKVLDGIRDMDERGGTVKKSIQCHKCGREMNSWDMRLTKTFKVLNTCEQCFCEIYDMDRDRFRDQMEDFFDMRPCQGL